MKSLSKIQVQLKDGNLLRYTRFDAEQIEEYKHGQTFDLVATGKRSNPHHNFRLHTNNVCKATGKWATHRHLHDELKWACGYVRMRWNGLANCHMRVIDSISFDEMNQKFNKYFEMAIASCPRL